MKKLLFIIKNLSLKERFIYILYFFYFRLQRLISKEFISNLNFINDLQKNDIKFLREKKRLIVESEINSYQYKIALRKKSSDHLVFKQIILEKELYPLLEYLKIIDPKVIIDAGANIGLASIYLKSFFPSAKLICYEPSLENYNQLKHNIVINQIDNIVINQKGLWSENKTLYLSNNFRDKKDWSITLSESECSDTLVNVITPQAIFSEYSLDYIDYFKIDIEGAESELFKNFEFTSEWLDKVKMISIEIHNEFNCRIRIIQILSKGFFLFETGELLVGINTKFLNSNDLSYIASL